MKIRATNPELVKTVRFLKKKANETGAAIWRDVASFLAKPKHRRTAVNLGRINRYTKSQDRVIVPGKILGAGVMEHPVDVAAFSFSKLAKEKILKAKGKCYTINEFVEKNLDGSKVKIIG